MKIVFACLAVLAVIFIALALISQHPLKPADAAPIFAGLLAFLIVWWQGHLITRQMELQAMIELDKEWNCNDMLRKRSAAWTDKGLNKEKTEAVLEFLEKVSTLERKGIISADLVWDTFGWYVLRYAYYSSDLIIQFRKDWAPKEPDPTLYEDLETLADKLLKREIRNRNERKCPEQANLTKSDVKAEFDKTKKEFVKLEIALASSIVGA